LECERCASWSFRRVERQRCTSGSVFSVSSGEGFTQDQLEQTLQFLKPIRDRVLDRAAIDSNDIVLDLGSGDGLIAFGALERLSGAGIVIFSDVSSELLIHSEDLAKEMGVRERCRFVQAPAEDLSPLEDESIDVVTARSVLIYVDDKRRSFEEIHRVLKPGGRLSIYEPINQISIVRTDDEFSGGFQVGPVRDIAQKVEAVFRASQPVDTDSMLNFDERDLITWLEATGFTQIEMDYEVRIGPVPGMNWETYANMAFNPRMPTLNEAMDQSLTTQEKVRFVEYLRPLVERGERRFRLGVAYVRAVK
jgi:ubiquinone/menaquinone biosynthesis C-methylase UbiE